MAGSFKLYGLDHIMQLQGMTGNKLAKKMKRHAGYRTYIGHLRTLKKGCMPKTINDLCKALDCEPIDLMEPPTLIKAVNQFNYLIAEYIRSVNALQSLDK